MALYTWPHHSISCDSAARCLARLEYEGYTEDNKLITAAMARKLAERAGWRFTAARRSSVSGKVYTWAALCPDHAKEG